MEKNGILVSRELAEKELEKWYDYRNVPEELRIEVDDESESDFMYERVLKAAMAGRLQFEEETGNLIYTLKDPLVKQESKEVYLNTLTIKPRYRRSELDQHLKGVKAKDIEGRTRAYMSAITGVDKGLLGRLWNSDYDLIEAVYILFLRE